MQGWSGSNTTYIGTGSGYPPKKTTYPIFRGKWKLILPNCLWMGYVSSRDGILGSFVASLTVTERWIIAAISKVFPFPGLNSKLTSTRQRKCSWFVCPEVWMMVVVYSQIGSFPQAGVKHESIWIHLYTAYSMYNALSILSTCRISQYSGFPTGTAQNLD